MANPQSEADMVMERLSPVAVRPKNPIPTMVHEGLARLIGRSKADVVDFYVDSRLAANDPQGYERAIEGLLGESAGRLLITALGNELNRMAGVAGLGDGSFLAEVKRVERAVYASVSLGTDM